MLKVGDRVMVFDVDECFGGEFGRIVSLYETAADVQLDLGGCGNIPREWLAQLPAEEG